MGAIKESFVFMKGKVLWIVVILLMILLLNQGLKTPAVGSSRNPVDATLYQKSVSYFSRGNISSGDFQRETTVRELKLNITGQRIMFFKPGLDLYIHRAFRDERLTTHSVIRIFGLEKLDAVTGNFTCQWAELNEQDIRPSDASNIIIQEVPAEKYSIDTRWPHWGFFYACNFDCWIPKNSRFQTVHLVSETYGSDFELKLEETTVSQHKRDLAVCVKPLTGKFEVAKFVEWIEIQSMAGIQHFVMYDTDLHGPARFVLDYYADRGIVTLIKFPYLSAVLHAVEPPPLSSQNRYAVYQQVYLVAYHDCLYRFMGMYKFLEIIDIDEIMLPTAENNWPILMNRLLSLNPKSASFMFLTSWHFEESGVAVVNGTKAPSYLYMQRYAIANEPIDNQPKSVIVTERAVTVNFHGVVNVIRPEFRVTIVPWREFGAVHHYRGTCKGKFQPDRCAALMKNARVDRAVTRYAQRTQTRVKEVLDYLQLTRL